MGIGRASFHNSLSDWAYAESCGLVRSHSALSWDVPPRPAEQLLLLYCALNSVFAGKLIYWHPPEKFFQGKSRQNAVTYLLGNIGEYVFLRDFLYRDTPILTQGQTVPSLLQPWIVNDRLMAHNLPSSCQIKLASLNLNASWLICPDANEVVLMFSGENICEIRPCL